MKADARPASESEIADFLHRGGAIVVCPPGDTDAALERALERFLAVDRSWGTGRTHSQRKAKE